MSVVDIRLSTTTETLRLSRLGPLSHFRMQRERGRSLAAIRLHVRRPKMVKIEFTREQGGTVLVQWMWFATPVIHSWVRGGGCIACDRLWKDHSLKERTIQP